MRPVGYMFGQVPPPGPAANGFEFDPWVPPEVQAQTIAWAQAEHPVTPEAYAAAQQSGGWPPWGVRPEIDACASRGGRWSPDGSFESLRGLGGRCDLADGQVCGALDFLRGACPGEPPVTPPDPIDPWTTPPVVPPGPSTGESQRWLLLIAAVALLG